jgi:hypothetical protein
MSKRSFAALIAVALACAGCSIRPVPDDSTHIKTKQIVHRIRCEMSYAVIDHVVYFNNNSKRPHKHIDMDDVRQMTAQEARKIVTDFAGLGVVYAFTLDMTESNIASIGADIIKPIGTIQNGLFTVSPSLSNSLSRQNTRTFTLTDNFESLRTLKKKDCNYDVPPNFEYPITGTIGLAEELHTFISLTFQENLSKIVEDGKDFTYDGKGAAPAMADTIKFTTIVSAGSPTKITLNQVGNNWQFAQASSGLSASRVDMHQVIIGLGLPTPLQRGSAVAALSGSAFITTSAPPKGPSGGIRNAFIAVNQQIYRYEAPPRINF